MVLDTNILIYATGLESMKVRRWVADAGAKISVVSRIEVLGFHRIVPAEMALLVALLKTLPELPLDESVVLQTVTLRQQRQRVRAGQGVSC